MDRITGGTKNLEYRHGIAASCVGSESPRASTSSYEWEIQASFYGFGMARMLNAFYQSNSDI